MKTTRYLATGLLVLPLLTACATRPSMIVQQTPANFAYECTISMGCNSSQEVADHAQAHCLAYGKNARLVNQTITSSGNLIAVYHCAGRARYRRAYISTID